MMMTLAMIGYTIGYALAAATRAEEGSALYLPVPARLRRFVQR
jgi:hypothetical protein